MATVQVVITATTLTPETAELHIGDTVEWVGSPEPYRVQSQGPAFDSGLIPAGQPYSYTYEVPGPDFEYNCLFPPRSGPGLGHVRVY